MREREIDGGGRGGSRRKKERGREYGMEYIRGRTTEVGGANISNHTGTFQA